MNSPTQAPLTGKMSLLPNLIKLVNYLRTFVQQHESALKDNKYMETDRLSLSDVAKILR